MDSTRLAIQHEQLARESGELLPARQTLDLVNIKVAPVIGVNLALALNAATTNSTAHALAGQAISVAWRG